ncbi:MAG TPA: hypothetical protein VIY52_11905, partial [Streptosporangiaceae bacterium]
MTTPVIELRGLARTYAGPPPVPALRPADLVIEPGSRTTLRWRLMRAGRSPSATGCCPSESRLAVRRSRTSLPQGMPRPRLTARDATSEAVAGIVQRPGRAALTMLGTVLGVGAFVAVLGLTATGAGQISHQFT